VTDLHPSSPLAGLLKAHEERVKTREVTYGIPGTSVFVKYRALEQSEIVRLRKPVTQAEKQGGEEVLVRSTILFARMVLLTACLGIYVRDEETGQLQPADPAGAAPVFDAHLCELFSVEVPAKGSDIVPLVYSDAVAGSVATKLLRFSEGGEIETLEDTPGN